MERDAIYCRYSSTNQDRGVSIELQLDVCRKLAGSNPLEFIDRAVSGRTMQRAAFSELLDAAEKHDFDRLIVYKWDRFGRNSETHAVINDLEDFGVKVTSATEGDDFLARGVGLLVSESYSRQLSQRVRDSMRLRFRDQKAFLGGSVAYGYKVEAGADGLKRPVINPPEAEMVRMIYKIYLTESIGVKRIAKRLDQGGYLWRKGGKWTWKKLYDLLHDEIYIGNRHYGKTSDKLNRKTGKSTKVPNEKWLTYHDENLRIINDADFKRAQALLAERTSPDYRAHRQTRAFTHRVFCGVCGGPVYTRHTTRQKAIMYHYLVCGKRDRLGPDACQNPSRPREEAVLALVQKGISRVLQNRDAIVARALEIAEKQLNTNESRRLKLTAELAKVEQGITRFSKLLRNPDLSEVEMRGSLSQIGLLEKERDTINAALRDIAAEGGVDRRALIGEITGVMKDAEENILNVTNPAVLNAAIHRFCGKIMVMPDGKLLPDNTTSMLVPLRMQW